MANNTVPARNGAVSGPDGAVAGSAKPLVTYPPPGTAKLGEAQREPFRSIIAALVATKFDRKAIDGMMPGLIAQMASICATNDDQRRMIGQLDDWVRWNRLGGYYLSYMAQAAMQALGTSSFIPACLLFANAQNQFAEDLSLVSLENAYTGWQSYCAGVNGPAGAAGSGRRTATPAANDLRLLSAVLFARGLRGHQSACREPLF